MPRPWSRAAASAAGLIAAVAITFASGDDGPRGAPARAELLTLSAKVEAIDYASRVLAVKGPLGRMLALKVDDRVRNFGKLRAGDEIVITYAEATAVAMSARDDSSTPIAIGSPSTKTATAQPSPMRVTARIEAIDAANARVLLAGSNARFVEVKVDDPAMLRDLQVGDDVHAVYSDALVVGVAPVKR